MYFVAAAWVETMAGPEMKAATASPVNVLVFIIKRSLYGDI
jgi:hypothetical protein